MNSAFEIHNDLGPGLLESVYEVVLWDTLRRHGFVVERQRPIQITFRGIRFDEGFRADLIIDEKVLVELKSVEALSNLHKKQLHTYLRLTGLRLGMDFALGCPEGYLPDPEIVAQAAGLAAVTGARLLITHDTAAAVAGAHAVYTDVWASMGQEQEAVERKRAFRNYQVNDALVAQARPDAIFMHCLPAHRGEEVTDSIMEHPRSVVFDQAENRLHAQKALLLMMLS